MWHKLQKDLLSYYSKQKVNGVMGVNGIMRTCHKQHTAKTNDTILVDMNFHFAANDKYLNKFQ